MKKYKITLVFLQLLTSTLVMMAEANTTGFEFMKAEKDTTEERDLEMEASQETDAFPDLITLATHLYR